MRLIKVHCGLRLMSPNAQVNPHGQAARITKDVHFGNRHCRPQTRRLSVSGLTACWAICRWKNETLVAPNQLLNVARRIRESSLGGNREPNLPGYVHRKVDAIA